MNSTATLVNPDDLATRVVFGGRNTLNAKLLINGQVQYKLSTTDRLAQHTKVLDATVGTELASIRRRTFCSDKITFANYHGGIEHNLSDVVQKCKTGSGHPLYVMHTEQGDFCWKIDPVHILAFVSMSDHTDIIAYREVVFKPRPTYTLVIRKDYGGITDYIVATFLVLEHELRKMVGSPIV